MEKTPELNFLITLLPLATVIFTIALGVILLNQHFRKNLYQQKLEQEELKTLHQLELLRSSIHAQEVERKRIASDLHDELGAVLAIARMHLIQLEQQNAVHEENVQLSLQNVRKLTESALASMRRISHELMPPQLEAFGIIKTLEALAASTNATNGMHMEVISASNLPELPWGVTLGLYRISLELIANTLKHSLGTEIKIRIDRKLSLLVFEYCDNGKGVSASSQSGLGIKNLEARVSALGGTIVPHFADNTGFNIILEIPLGS